MLRSSSADCVVAWSSVGVLAGVEAVVWSATAGGPAGSAVQVPCSPVWALVVRVVGGRSMLPLKGEQLTTTILLGKLVTH
jgi:hypothetical protein